jgi:hypothetical protein
MIAGALSPAIQRSPLAGQAFTEFAADLAQLPPERVTAFSLFLPWLPGDMSEQLSENFGRRQPRPEAAPGSGGMPAFYLRQGIQFRDSDPEAAVGVLRKGIAVCPMAAEWNSTRGALKIELAEQLFNGGQRDEAARVLTTITPVEISQQVKNRYDFLMGKLAPSPKH